MELELRVHRWEPGVVISSPTLIHPDVGVANIGKHGLVTLVPPNLVHLRLFNLRNLQTLNYSIPYRHITWCTTAGCASDRRGGRSGSN